MIFTILISVTSHIVVTNIYDFFYPFCIHLAFRKHVNMSCFLPDVMTHTFISKGSEPFAVSPISDCYSFSLT